MALVQTCLLHHLSLRHRVLVHVFLDGLGYYCLVSTVWSERERERERGRESEKERGEREGEGGVMERNRGRKKREKGER